MFAFVEQRRGLRRLVTIVIAQWWCVHTSLLGRPHRDATGGGCKKAFGNCGGRRLWRGVGKGLNLYQEVVMTLLKSKSDFVSLCIGAQIQVITLRTMAHVQCPL